MYLYFISLLQLNWHHQLKFFLMAYKGLFILQLTLLMLKTEYSSFGVNTMPADAQAPTVSSTSAGMVLTV